MTSESKGSWAKINRIKYYVKYSNLLLVPWFFIGLSLSLSDGLWAAWFLLFILIFKVPVFFLIRKLPCPACGKPFVTGWMSIAFAKECRSCGTKIGELNSL